MKTIIITLVFILLSIIGYNQTVGISDDATFVPSSLMHVKSSTFGGSLFTVEKGSVFFHILNNGNVGVNTSNPLSIFHINGVARFGLASTTTGSQIWHNSTNANTVTINSGVVSTSYNLTLPTSQGLSGSYVQNDGSGNLSWRSFKETLTVLTNSGSSYSDNQTIYSGAACTDGWTSEPYAQTQMPSCNVTNFQIYVPINTVNDVTVFTIRKNAANTTITISVPSNGIGWYQTTGNVLFNEGDKISLMIVIPNVAGTMAITPISATIMYQSR